MLLPLLLLVADPPSLLATATSRLSTACREAACAGRRASPYRIDDDADEDRGLKTRAVADDGRRCQVIGTRMCTRPPRTWLRADLNR